ncbi:DUF4224 domain-containing protein [Paraburkholderia pallida]|uniref:DUF4224 domain-containing protein n=1 Tax=Paraburkholderia pallida TaxID=2547399 RepID=UPI001E3AF566|nr:DUF4224 domain-containing protein [Paraburkholderia pallida]
MSETFLSEQEVAELTDIKTGQRGKTREQLQVEWLRTSGIPFWTSARGRPVVARTAIEGRAREEAARIFSAKSGFFRNSHLSSTGRSEKANGGGQTESNCPGNG